MATKIARPAESWPYVLKIDREAPSEQQSRFVLRPMTQGERAAMRDEIARVHREKDGARSVISRTNRVGVEIALAHIVSIENFPAGAPQPWPADAADREKYLEMLGDSWLQEIADEVWEKSTAGDDVKNS